MVSCAKSDGPVMDYDGGPLWPLQTLLVRITDAWRASVLGEPRVHEIEGQIHWRMQDPVCRRVFQGRLQVLRAQKSYEWVSVTSGCSPRYLESLEACEMLRIPGLRLTVEERLHQEISERIHWCARVIQIRRKHVIASARSGDELRARAAAWCAARWRPLLDDDVGAPHA